MVEVVVDAHRSGRCGGQGGMRAAVTLHAPCAVLCHGVNGAALWPAALRAATRASCPQARGFGLRSPACRDVRAPGRWQG